MLRSIINTHRGRKKDSLYILTGCVSTFIVCTTHIMSSFGNVPLPPLSSLSAPGNESSSSSRRTSNREIASQGRGQPCTQQGMVVGNVKFAREEFDKRKLNMGRNANDLIAPLGDPSSFQAMQGEVCFAPVNDYGVTSSDSLSSDIEVSVTTTVNGWRKDEDAIVVGVVRNARPLSSQDSAGTCAFIGTQTIINTGPDDIVAGDMVYISLYPMVVIDDRGVKRPQVSIEEPGIPGYGGQLNAEGEYAPKFRPSTYAIRDNSIYSFIAKGVKLLNGHKFSTVSPAAFTASMNKMSSAVKTMYLNHDMEMPARHYLAMEISQRAISEIASMCITNRGNVSDAFVAYTNPVTGVFVKELESLLEPYFERKQRSRKKFIEALGVSSSSASRHDWRPSKRAKLDNNNSDTPNVVACGEHMLAIYKEVSTLLETAKLECVCEQHNFMRKRVLGKCIKGGPPGGGMDIALGYGHT